MPFVTSAQCLQISVEEIRATWENGQIVPSEPVNWPEGIALLVEPLATAEKIGLDESEWRDDAASIAAWVAWVDTIEPLVLSDEERVEWRWIGIARSTVVSISKLFASVPKRHADLQSGTDSDAI